MSEGHALTSRVSRRALFLGGAGLFTEALLVQHRLARAQPAIGPTGSLPGQPAGTLEARVGGTASLAVEFLAGSSGDRRYVPGRGPKPKPSELDEQIAVVKGDGSDVVRVKVPLKSHSVISHPRDPNAIFAFSKEDTVSAIVAVKERSVKLMKAADGFEFAGHGIVLDTDPNLVLTGLRHSESENEGQLAVYDRHTGKLVERFTSHGPYPHEMRLLEGGKTLAVINGGVAKSNVAFIDLATKRLIESIPGPPAPHRPRHFVMLDDGTCAIGTLTRPDDHRELQHHSHSPAILMTGKRGGGLRAVHLGAELTNRLAGTFQYLSLAYAPSLDIVAATAVGARALVLFGLKEEKEPVLVEMEQPVGVVLSPSSRSFIVSTSTGPLIEVDAANGAIVAQATLTRALNGSHLSMVRRG